MCTDENYSNTFQHIWKGLIPEIDSVASISLDTEKNPFTDKYTLHIILSLNYFKQFLVAELYNEYTEEELKELMSKDDCVEIITAQIKNDYLSTLQMNKDRAKDVVIH